MLRRLGIGLLLAGLATLWLLRGEPMAPMAGDAGTSQASDAPTKPATPADSEPATATPPIERELAVADLPAVAADQLVVQVRGLHPEIPWTTPLQVHGDALDGPWIPSSRPRILAAGSMELSLAADGTAIGFLPPSGRWWLGAISAEDPNYTSFSQRFHGPGPIRVVIDVSPLATVRGRVVDSRGQTVRDVYVTAFPIVGARTQGRAFAKPEHDAVDKTGNWQLRIPANSEALVVAVPTASHRVLLEKVIVNHPSLLPTSTRVQPEVGHTVDVGDLVLGDAAELHGNVRWTNGEPVPAMLQLAHRSATKLLLASTGATVLALPNGSLLPSSLVETADDGSFRMPVTRAESAEVFVELLSIGLPLAGRVLGSPAPPDGRVTITLPLPVTVRAVRDGGEVANARIEIEGRSETFAPSQIVPNTTFRVRAVDGRQQGAWVRLGPVDAGRTVDLEVEAKQ